ncbi:hypothetical protein W02_23830 [Nitrospira sp. KM1]|uniref:hypothetical protein n=1 Tax=Nitrospira sp. KM1 TaxID=1936990 RepID=UPI0013A713DB|nr:hypothetical protein [Nitrospira sp. KM1]BCA55243.1 hypothetical protein W02_23830 [Nitrospira sp. KM1]
MSDPHNPAPAAGKTKPLDTVVKLALMVFFGSFGLIWGGMYLSRPDRSIPPYSIGSQEGTAVAIHVPAWTSDTEIQTLIERFRKVGHETRNFGPMKIRPTTPDDPKGRYRNMTIYIFTHEAWAEASILHQYVVGVDREVRDGFRRAMRGLYRLTETEEEGRIGPLVDGPDSAATAAYSRQLFKDRLTPLP